MFYRFIIIIGTYTALYILIAVFSAPYYFLLQLISQINNTTAKKVGKAKFAEFMDLNKCNSQERFHFYCEIYYNESVFSLLWMMYKILCKAFC